MSSKNRSRQLTEGSNGPGVHDGDGKGKRMRDTKKVTSIARQINIWYVLDQLFFLLGLDALAVFLLAVGVVYQLDVTYLGKFLPNLPRKIFWEGTIESIVYEVGTEGSAMFYQSAIGPWLSIVIWAVGIILVIEVMNLIGISRRGTSRIRQKLYPLNQMAARTEALSSMELDKSKYQNLEDAISHLSVETPDARIEMNDKELQGLEKAVNNLLDRMRNSYEQQTRFVSDASHELRTPIAVIQGYVNLLDRWGKEEPEILEESIQAIKQEAGHMQKLIEQLLFLARGDSNRQKLEFVLCDLGNIMEEVYQECCMIDETHLYEFQTEESLLVRADRDMLKQSARILLDNAAKYTKEGETIKIRAGRWEDGKPFYSVQDCGIGMSAYDVRHAFERFYRADKDRTNRTGGTGLGLSIAKWIIDQHKGYYSIVSREGIGTRISVILPEPDVKNAILS